MGKPAARLGDPTAHGGVIVLGFPMVLIGGMPAARLGDMHMCPMLTPGVPPIPHVGGPIMLGSPMVFIGGTPAARMGDMATCVGPPDTIVMGCPTVLIGEGGSGSASGGGAGGGAEKNELGADIAKVVSGVKAMTEGVIDSVVVSVAELTNKAIDTVTSAAATAIAAAAHALTDNVESSTKEGHWIEFEFIDKAGNPVSGIEYELTHPDKKESEGSLKSDGKIRRDAQTSGEGKVVLKNLLNAKWSKEIAKVGEKVKLSAEVQGIKDGSEALVKIYRKDINGSEKVVKTVECKVSGNKIETELQNNFDEPEKENSNSKKYSSASYYFEALAEECKSRSGFLFIEDFIELELKDSEDKAMANEEFVLFLPNGKVETGKLDSNGYKKIEKIPAGKYSVRFPNLIKKQKT